ncbi:MAG: hypothetical protein E7338_05105 [Clostridiales bacterium]|nr:hypothetical protein [Clostridiales bacterium]
MATAKKTTAAKPAAKKVEKFELANLRLVEKRTYGYFGDPAGYEESLYVTNDGTEVLYTNGGKDSKYSKESFTTSKSAIAAFKKA